MPTTESRSTRKNRTTNSEAATEVARRLVVELNRHTASDLAWLVEEEELTKTTLVNRAVQVYKVIMEAQRNGAEIIIDDPDRGQQRLRFV